MKISTGVRKKESERRKILWKNTKWTLLRDPSFQYGDNFSRLDLSHTDRRCIWCICLSTRNRDIPSLDYLSLCCPLLFWHCDLKWLPSLLIFLLYVYPMLVFSHLKRGSHVLLLRIWINLRLSLLFLRHPLAFYKGMHFAVQKGEQFCLD